MIIVLNGPLGVGKSTLAEVLALLVARHRRSGYRQFVIEHCRDSPEELDDLGEPFDVSAAPADLVDAMRSRLGLR